MGVIENKRLDNPVFAENYINYLEQKSQYTLSEDIDLVSKVDILMLQMKRLFEKRRSNDVSHHQFFKEMETINNSISRHIPYDAGNSVTSEWIGKFLEKVVPVSDCALLISLGQSVYNFKESAIMASAIWQGSFNYDSWGRACCIHAAVSHWKRLGGNQVNNARTHLNSWIRNYLKNPNIYAINKGINKYYDNQIDLDIATALGGLCHLGFDDDAIEYLNSKTFDKNHPCTVASDLVVILFLVSHNEKRNNIRRNKAQVLIDTHFSRISNSSVLFLAHEFLENNGYVITAKLNQKKVLTVKPFGATIASAANSKGFRQYAYDNGDTMSMIGGIIPDRM